MIKKINISIPIHAGWMPDLPKEEVGKRSGLITAKNVLPVRESYHPVSDKSVYNSTAAADMILAGFCAQDTSGRFHNYVGTLTKLYRFNDVIITNVTNTGGDYAGGTWSFAEYGDWVVATNFGNNVQVIKGHSAANFEDLGGSPKLAKFALMNSGHLILAHLNDSGTIYPKKIQYSAREDIEDWIASVTTGAGSQDFPDMIGNITGMGAIGEAFVLAAENSLTIGYYVGGHYTFGFQRNAIKNIGCYFPNSFISIGNKIFFWSKETIYSFDGENIVEIGKYIKSTVFNTLTRKYGDRVTVAHDKINNCVVWSYPESTSSGEANKLLYYNYLEDRFTIVNINSNCIWTGATGGIVMDTLTTTLIDDLTEQLIDSPHWSSKTLEVMIGFTDHKIYTLSGTDLEAELETGEFNQIPNNIMISKAYLPIEGTGIIGRAKVKHRRTITEDQNTSKESTIRVDGSVNLRSTNKYLSLNFKASNFDQINKSIDVEIVPAGRR